MAKRDLVVKLTDDNVKTLPPVDGKRTDYTDTIRPGLILRVSAPPSRNRTYAFSYRTGVTKGRVTIGKAKTIRLADAREAARLLGIAVSQGKDPAAQKRIERNEAIRTQTSERFRDVCDRFVEDQGKLWRPATRKGWTRYIENEIKPALGDKLPTAVSADDVRDLIDGIRYGVSAGVDEKGATVWKRKPAATSAERCYEVLRRLCKWMVYKRYIPLSPCVAAQPFERKRAGQRAAGSLKPLSDAQLRGLFEAVKGTEIEDLVALIARTCVRSHEARSARTEDIRQNGIWSIPAEFHKNGPVTGKPHLVPLSKGALRVIRARMSTSAAEPRGSNTWLFEAPTTKCTVCERAGHMDAPNAAATIKPIKEAAGIDGRGLLHRLRDTIKTRLSEHGTPERVSEHIMGHVVPGIAGTYDHAEMLQHRREALDWWDSELDRILAAGKRTNARRGTTKRTGDPGDSREHSA